jgi:hypothetical protein
MKCCIVLCLFDLSTLRLTRTAIVQYLRRMVYRTMNNSILTIDRHSYDRIIPGLDLYSQQYAKRHPICHLFQAKQDGLTRTAIVQYLRRMVYRTMNNSILTIDTTLHGIYSIEEAAAMQMARAAGMPVPKVLSCGEHPYAPFNRFSQFEKPRVFQFNM